MREMRTNATDVSVALCVCQSVCHAPAHRKETAERSEVLFVVKTLGAQDTWLDGVQIHLRGGRRIGEILPGHRIYTEKDRGFDAAIDKLLWSHVLF